MYINYVPTMICHFCVIILTFMCVFQDAVAVLVHGVWCGGVSGLTSLTLPSAEFAFRNHPSSGTKGTY